MKKIRKSKYYLQKNFQETVLSKIQNLIIFPKMYPKLPKTNYRKIPMKNYIIIYTVEKNLIKIWDIVPTKTKDYIKYIK